MGSEQSNLKYETTRKSSNNLNINLPLKKVRINNKIDYFARGLKSQLKNYYPFTSDKKDPNIENKIIRSRIIELIDSDKSFDLAVNFKQNVLHEISLSNNLDIISSTVFNNKFVINSFSVLSYIDNKKSGIQEILIPETPNFNSGSNRTITTVSKEIDDLESNMEEYYKELISQKEKFSVQGNNTINSNKILMMDEVLKIDKRKKYPDTKTSVRSPHVTHRKYKISKSPENDKAANNKSEINSLNYNKKTNSKKKIIKLDSKLIHPKKDMNKSPKYIVSNKSLSKDDKVDIKINQNNKSKPKSILRKIDTEIISDNGTKRKNFENTPNKLYSKSPTHNEKVKTIIYKPELSTTKNSNISKKEGISLIKEEKSQNKSITKNSLIDQTSYPGIIKISYSHIMKKRIEDGMRFQSPQAHVKTAIKSNYNKANDNPLNNSNHDKNKKDESIYKNIKINIK